MLHELIIWNYSLKLACCEMHHWNSFIAAKKSYLARNENWLQTILTMEDLAHQRPQSWYINLRNSSIVYLRNSWTREYQWKKWFNRLYVTTTKGNSGELLRRGSQLQLSIQLCGAVMRLYLINYSLALQLILVRLITVHCFLRDNTIIKCRCLSC